MKREARAVFMNVKPASISAIFALVLTSLAFSETPSRDDNAIVKVESRLDTSRSYVAGNIIELAVIATSRSYLDLSLQPPVHPHARLLEIQPFPTSQNEEGLFQNQWIVLYQIGRSGSLVLEGGSIVLSSEPESEAKMLPEISFNVAPIGKDPLGDSPESWVDEASSNRFLGFFGIVALLAIIITVHLAVQYLLRRRIKRIPEQAEASVQAIASRLQESLEKGDFKPEELERFLLEYQSKCSDRLVALIEATLYSRNLPIDELTRHLKKEFAE